MDNLPIELISHIFSFLNPNQARSVFWTCKKFAEIIGITKLTNSEIYTLIDKTTNFIYANKSYLLYELPRNKFVKEIFLNAMRHIKLEVPDKDISDILTIEQFKHVNHLNSRWHKWVLPSDLGKIEHITFNRCLSLVEVQSLKKTKELILSDAKSVSNMGDMPKLELLSLASDFSDFKKYKKLKTLSLTGNNNLENLKLPASIKSINIVGSRSNYIDLTNGNNIESIYLFGCENIERLDVMPSVSLTISHCYKFDDFSSITNIREINLSALSIKSVNFLSHIQNLTRLILSELPGVESISNLSNLELLQISYCTNLFEISNLRNIKLLRITHSRIININNLTDIRDMFIGACSSLKNVTMCGVMGTIQLHMIPYNADRFMYNSWYQTIYNPELDVTIITNLRNPESCFDIFKRI